MDGPCIVPSEVQMFGSAMNTFYPKAPNAGASAPIASDGDSSSHGEGGPDDLSHLYQRWEDFSPMEGPCIVPSEVASCSQLPSVLHITHESASGDEPILEANCRPMPAYPSDVLESAEESGSSGSKTNKQIYFKKVHKKRRVQIIESSSENEDVELCRFQALNSTSEPHVTSSSKSVNRRRAQVLASSTESEDDEKRDTAVPKPHEFTQFESAGHADSSNKLPSNKLKETKVVFGGFNPKYKRLRYPVHEGSFSEPFISSHKFSKQLLKAANGDLSYKHLLQVLNFHDKNGTLTQRTTDRNLRDTRLKLLLHGAIFLQETRQLS